MDNSINKKIELLLKNGKLYSKKPEKSFMVICGREIYYLKIMVGFIDPDLFWSQRTRNCIFKMVLSKFHWKKFRKNIMIL